MPTKAKTYPKGRRTKPVGEGKLMRKTKTAGKRAVRVTRKQEDISTSGGKRKVSKTPRRIPKAEKAHRKG